jgi:hypothetical protein
MGIRDDQEAPRAEVEVARVADLNRLAVQVAGLGDVVGGFADLMTLARLFADPKALQAQLDAFAARDCKSRDVEQSAHRAVTAMNAREAELDAREAALDKREAELDALEDRRQARLVELDAREKRLSANGQRAELLALIETARNRDKATRRQVMSISRLDVNYNQILQSFPSWDQITGALLDGAIDADDIDGTQHLGADADEAAEHALPPPEPSQRVPRNGAPRRGAEQ